MMGTWGAGPGAAVIFVSLFVKVIKIIIMMLSVSTDLFLQMAPSLDTWGGGLTERLECTITKVLKKHHS